MFFCYKRKKNKALLFTVLALIAHTACANAQSYFDTETTLQERAVFAFFKATGNAPDYENWIKETKEYQSLTPKKQEEYLIKEMLRLGRGYNAYNKDKDVLELTVPVVVEYISPEEKDGKNDTPRLIFRFFHLENGKMAPFDFTFGRDILSLNIDRLDYFSNLELDPTLDKTVREKLPYENDEFDAELHLSTKVYKADYKNPIDQIEDIRRWAMRGKIAYIECVANSAYTNKNEALWNYIAPWYEEQYEKKNAPKQEEYPHPYDLFK